MSNSVSVLRLRDTNARLDITFSHITVMLATASIIAVFVLYQILLEVYQVSASRATVSLLFYIQRKRDETLQPCISIP